MQLDLFTILAVESAACLLFALWMGAYCVLSDSLAGMRWFTAAFILFGAATLLCAPRGILPDSLTLVASHAALGAGMASFHEGLLRQLGARRNLPGIGLALAALGTISAYLLGVRHDLLGPRIIVSCLIMIGFTLIGLDRLRRHTPPQTFMVPHMRVFRGLLWLVVLSSVLRIGLNATAPLPAGQVWAGALQSAPHVAYLIFQLGVALNLIWMSLRNPGRTAAARGS